jgi:hypothetical protein
MMNEDKTGTPICENLENLWIFSSVENVLAVLGAA